MGIAIITGASSGIGREFARLAKEYFALEEIWVIARRAELLEEIKSVTDLPIKTLALDLTNKEVFAEISNQLEKSKKDVSLLINCAGYGKFGSYADIDNVSQMGMIDLNCRALVGVTNCVLPYMKEGAKILQVCSIASFQPLPMANVYAASKAFVLNYSRALYMELKERRISVTALCPGWVSTEFFKTATDTKNPGAVTKYTFIVGPEKVARQGLKAVKKGKMTSIVSPQNKLLYVINKILPVKLVMRSWLLTQK